MKKILAIAVATAIAAPAMADMTIGGTMAAGYQATGGVGGFGIDTASIAIKGTETLENGLTVSANMGLGGLTRNNATGGPEGENAGLAISGDFGSISVATGRSGSGISSVAADTNNMSGEVLNYQKDDADNEGVTFSTTAGSLAVSVGASEAVGLAAGDEDRTLWAKVGTSAGPVSGSVDFWSFSTGDRVRLNLAVDAGAAVVKVGYEDRDNTGNEMAVGVTVPAGAWSLGAAYAKSEQDGGVEDTGYSVGATYTLSSNVSVNANYASWELNNSGSSSEKTTVLMTMAF